MGIDYSKMVHHFSSYNHTIFIDSKMVCRGARGHSQQETGYFINSVSSVRILINIMMMSMKRERERGVDVCVFQKSAPGRISSVSYLYHYSCPVGGDSFQLEQSM